MTCSENFTPTVVQYRLRTDKPHLVVGDNEIVQPRSVRVGIIREQDRLTSVSARDQTDAFKKSGTRCQRISLENAASLEDVSLGSKGCGLLDNHLNTQPLRPA